MLVRIGIYHCYIRQLRSIRGLKWITIPKLKLTALSTFVLTFATELKLIKEINTMKQYPFQRGLISIFLVLGGDDEDAAASVSFVAGFEEEVNRDRGMMTNL
jgi:hypothetical protein